MEGVLLCRGSSIIERNATCVGSKKEKRGDLVKKKRSEDGLLQNEDGYKYEKKFTAVASSNRPTSGLCVEYFVHVLSHIVSYRPQWWHARTHQLTCPFDLEHTHTHTHATPFTALGLYFTMA